jgi:hypothetical protein
MAATFYVKCYTVILFILQLLLPLLGLTASKPFFFGGQQYGGYYSGSSSSSSSDSDEGYGYGYGYGYNRPAFNYNYGGYNT